MFRTNVAGRPTIISVDPELNHYILQQEGNAVEFWYMDNLSKLVVEHNKVESTAGAIHKYARTKLMHQFGFEMIKDKYLPQIQQMVHQTLSHWSSGTEPVEVKQSSAIVRKFISLIWCTT